MAIMSRLRNLRYGHFVRLRHSKRTLAFLAAQDTRLTSSASGSTVDTVDVAAVAATGTLTNDGSNVTNLDTVTIGSNVYTFQDTLTNVAGNVKIGASNTATMTNLFHAINATGGTVGTDYATLCVAHPLVDATNPTGTTVVLTAKTASAAGNAIVTTENSTHLSFGAPVTLTGGVTATFGPTLTSAAHAITNGEGPYVLTAATTLPGGYTAGTHVWVHVVDANTISLARTRAEAVRGTNQITFTSAGTGALTLTKVMTSAGLYDLLRRNRVESVVAASDIDSLN